MAELPEAKVAKEGSRRRKPYKRKLKNFLLDSKLQLRYIITITVVSAVIAGVLGFLIWNQGSETSDDLVEFTQDTLGDDMVGLGELDEMLTDKDNTLVYTMVGFGCGLAVILTFFLLIMTHKVAGPLFKLSKHFDDLATGRFREVRPLRRLDMLRSFHTKFEVTHAALLKTLQSDCDTYERLVKAARATEPTDDLAKVVTRLEAHAKARRDAIG